MTGARTIGLVSVLAAAVLVTFGLGVLVLPPGLADEHAWETLPAAGMAVAGFSLLSLDVVLPVPSSIVLTAMGATLGFAVAAVVGTAGLTCAAVAGYAGGRLGHSRSERWLGDEAPMLRDRLERHGMAIVVLTRPVPVLAEVVTFLCGCGAMSRSRFLVASILGNAVTASAFAAAGSIASARGAAGWLALVGVLLLAAVLYGLALALRRRRAAPDLEQRVRAVR